jgi:hypothetical protein
MRSSMKYFDWMLVVMRASSEEAIGEDAGGVEDDGVDVGDGMPLVGAAPGVPPVTAPGDGGPAT